MSPPSIREARLHAATRAALVAQVAADADGAAVAPRWRVTSPSPGFFRPAVSNGALVAATETAAAYLGELEVLGQLFRLVVPAGPAGPAGPLPSGAVLLPERFAGKTRIPVAFGDELCTLDGAAASASATLARSSSSAAATAGLVVRAPSSGRFYGRPSPQKPPFLSPGDTIERGHTVCLLEVMKTFHRVTYDDLALPERAKVLAVLVAEESDVVAGQPLLSVEPA